MHDSLSAPHGNPPTSQPRGGDPAHGAGSAPCGSDLPSRRPRRPGTGKRALLACAWVTVLTMLLCAFCALPARALEQPSVNATAALLVDPETGTVLYESNADETRYPASMTKIMTALLTLENVELDEQVTVEASDLTEVTWDSTVAGLMAGETYTVRDLLYGLMLPSGNDAAYVLARYVGGTVDNFAQMMNDRAAQLGCTNTHFANPCGLHDDNHWSCARDIYRIAYAAMQNPTFAEIVATRTYTMPATDLQAAHDVENTNLLIDPEASCYYEPCFGIKTGNTTEAGRCLVAAAEQNGVTLYCVVMGCPSAQSYGEVNGNFTAALNLFEWGYANWSQHAVIASGTSVTSLPILGAWGGSELSVTTAGSVEGLLPNDLTADALEVSYELPEAATAPIAQGASLGTATYRYNGVDLGQVELVAGAGMLISPLACIIQLPQILTVNPALGIGTIAVAAAVLLVVVLVIRAIVAGSARKRAARAPRASDAYPHRRGPAGATGHLPATGAARPSQQARPTRSSGQRPARSTRAGAGAAAPVPRSPRRANPQDTASVLYPRQEGGAPTVHASDPFEPRSSRIARRIPKVDDRNAPSGTFSDDPNDTTGLWS